MAVAAFSPAPVMLSGRWAVCDGGKGPDLAGGSEAVVFDAAMGDADGAPRGPGDGRGSGVGLQRPGIGESGAVVAELGEHTSPGGVGQAGETGNDRVVGMLLEGFGGGLAEVLHTARVWRWVPANAPTRGGHPTGIRQNFARYPKIASELR